MAASFLNLAISHRDYLRAADTTLRREFWTDLQHVLEKLFLGESLGNMGNTAAADTCKVVVHDGAAFASQTVTWSGAGSNGDTVTIGGTVLTAVASGPTTAQYTTGASATATAANFVTAVNLNPTINKLVSASSSAGVVTLTCLVPGPVGNFITLAKVGAATAVGGATFAGGSSNAAVSFAG